MKGGGDIIDDIPLLVEMVYRLAIRGRASERGDRLGSPCDDICFVAAEEAGEAAAAAE